MKFNLSPIAVDTIFLALQMHQASIQNALNEVQAQLPKPPQPVNSKPTLPPTAAPVPPGGSAPIPPPAT